MAVRRIVANISTRDPGAAKAFYGDILGLDIVMDHDLDALLSEADQALYEAKQTGRNKVCRYRTRPVSA